MTTNHSMLQRTTPGMSQRKRLAAEAARKAKLVYPTTLQQPDAHDRVPTMSVADSALLQATLVQSRHAWTHTAFSRFLPEPPARGPGGKKYASDLAPVGLCTVCIGPHIFLDTKFYTVFNPTPPPPVSTSSTASNTAAGTPTEESPHSPSPTSPVVLGGSPAPERVIELIMARTANMAAEAAAAGTVPESLGPSFMDIDIPTAPAKATEASSVDSKSDCPSESNESKQASALAASALKEDDTNTTAPPKSESAEKSITPTSSGAKVRLPPRPQRPKHQVAFEFKENPGVRWLFPHESSLELSPAEGDEPARISASFYLPTLEEPRPGLFAAGTATHSALGLVPGPGQATTVVILEATAELWTGLQQSINDPAATYRFMMDKMKHIPPRAYVQYNLPINFPDEQLLILGLRKLPDHKVVPIASLEPSKRTLDNQTESQPSIKAKRSKAAQDENMSVSSKMGGISRKGATLGNSSAALAHPKQCVYCGCSSTPMWRRGPDGPHTLCNACGVKWRHGRIYVNNNSKATAPSLTGNPSVPYTLSTSVPDVLTTTAEAAVRMNHELYRTGGQEGGRFKYGLRSTIGHVGQDNMASAEGLSAGDADGLKGGDGDKPTSGKRRGAGKASTSAIPGPKMVPIHQIGETVRQSGRTASGSRKEKEKVKEKDKEKIDESNNATAGTLLQTVKVDVSSSPQDALLRDGSDRLSTNASPMSSSPVSASSTSSSKPTVSSASSGGSTPKTATSKTGTAKTTGSKTTAAASKASKQKTSASSGAITPPTTKPSPPTSAAAKLSLLKSLASAPRYQVSHPAAVATMNLADDGLALYATKNLYTNNTATFPLHFPTISIAFGPNNAYYMYPNCAVVLFENHFQIKLIQAGERTDIDVWKEGIDGTEFQVVDVGDGESMIVMKATLRQHLTRFDMELLNPDKNETSIVFRFRERLDGGGPPVKPLLEQWLTTEIPVAVPPAAKPPSS